MIHRQDAKGAKKIINLGVLGVLAVSLMILTKEQLDQLVAQAREHAPYETCGLIGGKDGRALKIFPIKNVAIDRVKKYLMDPQEQFNALSEIDKNEWDVTAIYHSHPATPAYPSPTDVNDAYDPNFNEELYPGTIYILISLANPEIAQVRAYEFKQREIHEVTIEVEEGLRGDEKTEKAKERDTGKGSRGAGKKRSVEVKKKKSQQSHKGTKKK